MITDGAILWLDASTLSLDDGAPVTLLEDLSVSGNDAVPYDVLNPPTYVADGYNGHGTIQFAGDTQGLTTLSELVETVGRGDRTVFVVMGRDVGGSIIANLGQRDLYKSFQILDNNGDYLYCPGISGMGNVQTDPAPAGQLNVYEALNDFNGDTLEGVHTGYINGAYIGTGANGPDIDLPSMPARIGFVPSQGFLDEFGNPPEWFDHIRSNGQFAEMIVYNRLLSESERLQVETYLTNKWAAPVPEPATLVMLVASLVVGIGFWRKKK